MALFGTDGIRGLANGETLTAEIAVDVAVAAAHILVESSSNKGKRPRAIVGQDSRASGEFLEAAVAAGLASAGIDVYRVGVLPTPAIAYLVGESGADLGVMISASHNPMPDTELSCSHAVVESSMMQSKQQLKSAWANHGLVPQVATSAA
jgi:phosphoglucosamine mutase